MEDRIKQAEQTKSWSGLTCKIFSFFGIAGTVLYTFTFPAEKFKDNIYLLSFVGVSFASNISLAALGSIAESSKRNFALTSLMVQSTNSASQLPISKDKEYSD